MENSKALTKATQKKIDEITKSLDLKQNGRTVVQLAGTDDPNKKTLELLSGEWDMAKPWFVVDEEGEVHALTSVESFMHFIHTMQNASNENFSLKLEKAIWKHFPVDFHDVWIVAMSELESRLAKNRESRILEVDIESLIERIHREHPNLFYHLKEEMLEQERAGRQH